MAITHKNEIIYKPTIHVTNAPMPAYIYHDTRQYVQKTKVKKTLAPLKKIPMSIFGFKKPIETEESEAELIPNQIRPPSPSRNFSMQSEENINEPLLRILSNATAAKLVYPQIAAAFNKRGLVKIRFYIYPNGNISQIILLASSGFNPLDNAALNAIRAISPVKNVDLYLTKPRYITAYIEFR